MTRLMTVIVVVAVCGGWFVAQSSGAPVYWVLDADGDWADAANWSSAPSLPGAGDDVTIDVGGTTVRTIELASGQRSVLGLQCEESLSITGGSLIVGANGGYANGDLSISRASLYVQDGGEFVANGATTMEDGHLEATAGSVLSLPNLTEWNMPTSNNVSVVAEGKGDDDTGALVDLSALVTITTTKYPTDFGVYARDGARVDLSALTLYDGCDLIVEAVGAGSRVDMPLLGDFVRETNVLAQDGGVVDLRSVVDCGSRCPNVQAIGWGSVVDLSSLGNCSCSSAYCDDCGFLVKDGGQIILPATLTELDGSSLTIGMGSIPTAQLTRFANATLTVNQGATPSFASLTTLEDCTLRVRDGGVVQIPHVTALLSGGDFEATGTSTNGQQALIDLSWVTTLDGYFDVTAEDGGKVDLSNASAASTDFGLNVHARGAGSVVDLSRLTDSTSLVGTSTTLYLGASTGGEIILPTSVTEIDNVALAIGAGATLPTALLTRILNSKLSTSNELSFPSLEYLYNTELLAHDGGRLALPSLTTIYMAPDESIWFKAIGCADDGAPARLDLSSITSFSDNACTLCLWAEDGGIIDLSSIDSNGSVDIYAVASGEGSVVDLSGLTTLSGTLDDYSSLEAYDGGTILLSATLPSTLRYTGIHLDAGSIQADQVKSIDDAYITAWDGSGARFANLTSLRTPRTLSAYGGGILSFPALQTVALTDIGTANSYLWEGKSGSTLDLSSVTTIYGNSWQLKLAASYGGTIDLSALKAVSGSNWRIDLDVRGSSRDATADLSRLPSLSGGVFNVTVSGENNVVDLSSFKRYAGDSACSSEWEITFGNLVKLHPSQPTEVSHLAIRLDLGATIAAYQLKLGVSATLNADSSTIDGSLINSLGTVQPESGGTQVGSFEVTGDYIQSLGGSLVLDIVDLNSFDQLVIGGDARLAGTLTLKINPWLDLSPDQEFSILVVDGVCQGAFSGRSEYSVAWTDRQGDDLYITYRGGPSHNNVVLTTRPMPVPISLVWDEAGPGNWADPRWIGDTPPDVPDEAVDVEVKSDAVTIDANASALTLALTSGQLVIEPSGTLVVGEEATINAGASLNLAGSLSAGSFTTTGTNSIAPGAELAVTKSLTVGSGLDMNQATLATTPQSTDILVNDNGSLTLGQLLRGALLSVSGSVQTAGAELTTLNVSGNGLLTASADVVAADTVIGEGTVRLIGDSVFRGTTMQFDATSSVLDTGTGSVEISESLKASDGRSFSITGGTFRASGANLADRTQPCTITLSGGLLTLSGSAIVPNGATGIWKLDEGAGLVAADSSIAGNDHTGTIAGPVWIDDAQHGTVLGFDGVDDALQIANTADMALSNPFTVALWINTSVKGGKLLGQDNGNGGWFLGEKALYVDATSGAVGLTGNGAGTLAGTSDVADGQWHHVAVTFNKSTSPGGQEIYIDGVQDTASRTYSGASSFGSVATRFGKADFNKGQAYAGLMDDVYFYDRSLTATEVADLCAAVNSSAEDLPNTSFCVTADSAVYVRSMEEAVALGDLTVASGVAVTFSGVPIRFQNVSGGDLASVAGNVTVAGALSAGNSPGTLDVVGSLTLDAGSVYVWELGESATDLVAVDGDLTLADGWTLQLADAGGTCDASEQLDLFTCTGLLSLGQGTIDPSVVQSSGGWDWSSATIAQDGSRVYLTGLTVVPEPSSLALLLAGGVAGWVLLRRR